MQDFNLYFYYKNRNKIRNSFFLESFSAKLKPFLLFHYREDNFKWIDNLIRMTKFLVFSIIYLIIILSTDFDYESLHMIAYVVFASIGFFIALFSLSYNRESLKEIEHDHYFRMLSENRNELIKQIIVRRINYGFLNWLIPLSFPLFICAALFTSFHFIIQYIVLLALYYLSLYIFIFITQKLLFNFLKRTVLISDIFIYIFSVLIVGFPIILHVFMIIISDRIANYLNALLMYASLSAFILFALWNLKLFIYKKTLSYSITHTLLVGTRKIYKENQLKKPHVFIRMFYGKDEFSNLILTKDLLSFYRKDKREVFSLIFVSLFSVAYAGFLITTIQTVESMISIISIDNIFLSVIMIFFVMAHYRYQAINWFSSEGRNLELFRKLKHKPISLYHSKLKLNSIVLLPMILVYAILPLIFIMTYDSSKIAYVILRILFILTYANILLEYPLINDTRKTLIKKYKDKLFMRAVDLNLVIFFVQGIGLSLLLNYISVNTIISQYPYIYVIVLGLIFVFMILTKIHFIHMRRMIQRKEV